MKKFTTEAQQKRLRRARLPIMNPQSIMKNVRLVSLGVTSATLLLGGCASSGGSVTPTTSASGSASVGTVASVGTAADVPRIGFLTGYAKLRPMPGGGGMLCWRADNVDWKAYEKVMIERILVYLKPGSAKPIDPTDLKSLLDYFHNALTSRIKSEAQIVTTPGPGVLRMQIALTNLVPTNALESLAGTAVPYGFVAEVGSGAATGKPLGSTPYLGQTGMEVRFLDGASGAVVGECADTEIGLKYAADLNAGGTGAAETWINGYLDSFSSWSYARQAFDKWAAAFAQRFAQLRATKT